MKVITRFAPSPTGFLHVGNLRTALVTWLYARSHSGQFILRIDDTDYQRSNDKYITSLKNDLNLIGINWDVYFRQSNRMHIYEKAKMKLIDTGRLYPCYETKEELVIKKKILLSKKLPPIYDRASLYLNLDKKKELECKGIKPYWRFLLKGERISWNDEMKGKLQFETKNLSDPIVVRSDGTLTYSLASIVDDIEYGITHIIRGEDHTSNSAIHIQLFQALSTKNPVFCHIPLLTTQDKKLSKRNNDFNIRELIKRGIIPKTISIFLSKIGSSHSIIPNDNISNLIKDFSLKKLSKSTVQYSYKELETCNTKVLHSMEFIEMKNIFNSLSLNNINENFWLSIRCNIHVIEDIKYWYQVCHEDIKTIVVNPHLIAIARNMLPSEKFSDSTWNKWISLIKQHTGLKGQNLFMPLRLALTGKRDGPDLSKILPLINEQLIIKRLDNN